jgi:nucleotide-binding universal stress UspA family protein
VGLTLLEQSKKTVVNENIPVQTLLKEGHIVEEILNSIEDGKYDLVVLGSRGQSKIKDLQLGSVSSGVAMYASCNILLVKN